VRFQLVKGRISSAKPIFNPEEILLRANALFRAEQSKNLRGEIAEKIEDLQHYDVLAMERVVAILSWGRSGSLLLSSYLDGHEDVMMLPQICSARLYGFFERYPSMPLGDKLIAYPALEPHYYGRFFDGEFAISPAQYYAAVQAILEFHDKWPPDFLKSRRAFFLFMHIAYNLALGRRPASSNPLIVYAQHIPDNEVARQLVEDFPRAKFVHTIRDPISSCDGMFHFLFGTLADNFPRTYTRAPYEALTYLTNKDRAHRGMESRTRTIRFEDLHRDTAETMRDLSDWLGLPYQATLLDSTFNGIPWMVARDGNAWSGPRLEQVERHSRNLSFKDRALLFALFHENFVDWNYPCPRIFGHTIVRCLVFVSLFLFPMKMEIIAARGVFKRWILPAVRQGNISRAIKSLLGIGFYRLKIIGLLTPAFLRRCIYGTTLLQVDHKRRPLERRDDGARAATSETTFE
jgi:hypothetical protein